jgi:ankyrin repeat protein
MLRTGIVPDVNENSTNRISYLHPACEYDRGDIVQLLLQHNADVNHIEPWNGRTALHIACAHNSIRAVQILIDLHRGGGGVVDLSTVDRYGETPVDIAIHHNHTDIVALLRREEQVRKRRITHTWIRNYWWKQSSS